MSNQVFHRSDTRGHAYHGWLDARHTFSFANYHDPKRVHFGVLRVLNDDTVAPKMGFGMHPHQNMEIITIPLEGALEHKDSMGNQAVIHAGEIQVMSAGTGVYHSEFNPSQTQPVKLLQIWLFPNKKNVQPRYDQLQLDYAQHQNQLQQILSPNVDDAGVWIHQNAWFHLGNFDQGIDNQYIIKRKGNGVYAFLISGSVQIGEQILNKRDGLGIWNVDSFNIKSLEKSTLLLMEVPMSL
jgi:quercetin 2,3-dioxygenase